MPDIRYPYIHLSYGFISQKGIFRPFSKQMSIIKLELNPATDDLFRLWAFCTSTTATCPARVR